VSIFKPWVARHVYNELLPNGGIVVDPCMGWGGRLLGTYGLDIEYLGFDLNPDVINCHKNMAKFIGSGLAHKPKFSVADAASIEYPECDLILTSPPYDNTEIYHGLENQCTDTTPIYDNILSSKARLFALNVPRKDEEKCVKLGKKHGLEVQQIFEMKTRTVMGRRNTYEPIIVFYAR